MECHVYSRISVKQSIFDGKMFGKLLCDACGARASGQCSCGPCNEEHHNVILLSIDEEINGAAKKLKL